MSLAGGPSKKVILIIVDAMRDDAARLNLGFVEGLVERKRAARMHARSVLPSMSRACYEAIMTGSFPDENGIVSNDTARRSNMRSLFDVVFAAGGTSVAVGYYFFSELYCVAPYQPALHCEWEAENEAVAHGRFYDHANFPDSHAICQAENLRLRYAPDFVMAHLNWPDTVGHRQGSDAKEYATALISIDAWIGRFYTSWATAGYTLFVTGDHGTNAIGYHGGTADELRSIPLYIIGSNIFQNGRHDIVVEQPTIASLICKEMALEPAPTMHAFSAEVGLTG
jgi:predicted AlkP superfamily pyrophosphatase or phosphodiesterase